MNSQFIRGLAAGGLLVVLSLVLPSETLAQRSGVEIWAANCGRCHILQPTNKYNAKDWRSVGVHMGIYARLTSAETEAVIAFLVSAARTDGAEGAPPPATTRAAVSLIHTVGVMQRPAASKEVYQRLCVPCHGAEGEGDGVAAIALNPKPRDFTSSEFTGEFTDEQLAVSITSGKGVMPSFGAMLTQEQVTQLVEYIRSFAPIPTAALTLASNR